MLLKKNNKGYKPFDYEWAFDAYKRQQQILWVPEEAHLELDLKDWNTTLTDKERDFLTAIFRFFTQSDIDVSGGYIDLHLPTFMPNEIRMMLLAFAYTETVHIDAYSALITALNMPDDIYNTFMDYQCMVQKHDYLFNFNMDNIDNILKTLAVYGAFTEGLQLFASFAMLLNFPRQNKMNGMGQIVTWSVKDETLHVESLIKLYHALKAEVNYKATDNLNDDIAQIAKESVKLENAFIDLAFNHNEMPGLKIDDVKDYIKFVCNQRLNQLGVKPIYDIPEHPLPWLKSMLNGIEHTNFFENRATEYSQGSTKGNWSEAWDSIL